jgi:protein subunit release factor B
MKMHPAMLDETALLSDCQLTSTRRSGPGGQHRNKVETAIILTHVPTGTSAEANERRSREANRHQALTRLRLRLAVEIRTPATKPTALWRSRATKGRISVSAEHTDFPALLAEAVNQLASCDFDHRAAAERLGVSATQLAHLLKKYPPAFALLNDERARRGMRLLK